MNDFTSLEGVEFSWQLGTQNRNTKDQSGQSRHQVLRFLTFSESKYHQVNFVVCRNYVAFVHQNISL